MKIRDFRSDTVTQPTKRMRQAMMEAEVGDDVLREDPSVKALEEYGAGIFKREAAMFVLSGTMANQIAVMTLANRGEEIILSENSHMYNLEVGGLAALSQVQVHPLQTNQGKYSEEQLINSIRRKGIQSPRTSIIALENTYNLNKGLALPVEYFVRISEIAKAYNVYTYLDGARIFNAAIAKQTTLAAYAACVDSLQVCLSKGLAAPIGSLLIGDEAFICKARWMRQRLGGGMRQAGHMAAAGLVALKEMRERLVEDHANAACLAEQLKQLNSSIIDLNQVETNILKLEFKELAINSNQFAAKLLEKGIKVKVIGENSCRMIMHKDITKEDINYTILQIKKII